MNHIPKGSPMPAPTYAGSQVQDHVDLGIADTFGHFAIVVKLARGCAGVGVADMAMDDSSPGLGRGNRTVGNLPRAAWHMRRPVLGRP